MDEDFNPDDLRPIPYRPDIEVMLGPWQFGGLFFVLLLLCGFCYTVGYEVGRHGTHNAPATGQPQSAQVSSLATGSGVKPSAGPQTVYRARSAADSHSPSNGTAAAPVSDSVAPSSPTPMPSAAGHAQALMVQIASVSHQEDANVLVGALRKRGYAVTMRHDPADDLFHVQIGPFTSLNDANAARQKLLNDGYNASIQP